MSIATVEQVQAALASSKVTKDEWGYEYDPAANLRHTIASVIPYPRRSEAARGDCELTAEDIKRWLEHNLTRTLNHNLCKGLRPWSIINVTEKLDASQPWIGIEYETGYERQEEYQKVVNFVWHNFNNSTIDSEGGGNWPCELTFPPIDFNDFMSDKCPMDRLYAFMKENNITVDDNWSDHEDDDGYFSDEHEGCVGTHCNISTPTFRQLNAGNMENVSIVLDNSLSSLSVKAVTGFLGRVPYGGFSVRGMGDNHWIEGKLFKSTGSAAEWTKYKQVIAKLAEAQEALSVVFRDNTKKKTHKEGRNLVITNFRKFLAGEDEEIVLGYRSVINGGWAFSW